MNLSMMYMCVASAEYAHIRKKKFVVEFLSNFA